VSALAEEAPTARAGSTQVQVWLTQANGSQIVQGLVHEDSVVLGQAVSAPNVVAVHPEQKFQKIAGFGGALTDSAAALIADSPEQSAIMNSLFGSGAHFTMVRLPVGASDLSQTSYNYDPTSDPTLTHFSIGHDRQYIIPILRQARALNGQLRVMAAAWSAPGWMKNGGSFFGDCAGSNNYLRSDRYATYARYLALFAHAYKAAGVPISLLSLQNEPQNCNSSYPTMQLDPPQEAALAIRLRTALDRRSLQSVRILAWDHNWYVKDGGGTWRSDWAQSTLAALPGAENAISAIGYHCYSGAGGYTVQSALKAAYPTKSIYFTECTGFGPSNAAPNLIWALQNDLIGPLRNWARGSLYWSLALDDASGPRIGGCSNCRGMLTIEPDGSYQKNEEYYAWAQFSRFIVPGAVRIDSSHTGSSALNDVAFQNPDGSIVDVVVNTSNSAASFEVASDGKGFSYTLPATSVVTFEWTP
jgi:glucosylceramidase